MCTIEPPRPASIMARATRLVSRWAAVRSVSANVFRSATKIRPSDVNHDDADFFDLERFPGKRGLPKGARRNLEWALMADGVELNNIYQTLESGHERALRPPR